MSKRPWSKLWHADIVADLRLRSCSLAVRGAYLGLYCLMHQGGGRLTVSVADVAPVLGCNPHELMDAVKKLVHAGIFEYLEDGALGCPELIEQLALSDMRAKVGKVGGKRSAGISKAAFAQANVRSKMSGSGSVSGSDQDGERERKEKPASKAPRGTPLTRFWDEEWAATHGGKPYEWTNRADHVQLARCLKHADGDEAEVKRRISAIIRSSDRWLAQNATPRLLESRWASLGFTATPLSSTDKAIHDAKNGTEPSAAIVDMFRSLTT